MPSIPEKDRVSLCLYHFSDNRRCRTPRSPHHQHFCFYHARLESQSHVITELADDVAYFFSAEYISANDLNTALARIFPAILRGDIKPRTAKTLVYLAQILSQTIPIGQHEYTNAYGGDYWRQTIRDSITANSDHLKRPSQPATQSAVPSPNEMAADQPTSTETEANENSPAEVATLAASPSAASPNQQIPLEPIPDQQSPDVCPRGQQPSDQPIPVNSITGCHPEPAAAGRISTSQSATQLNTLHLQHR